MPPESGVLPNDLPNVLSSAGIRTGLAITVAIKETYGEHCLLQVVFRTKTQWKLTEAVFFAEMASKRPEYVNQYVQWLEEERLVIVLID